MCPHTDYLETDARILATLEGKETVNNILNEINLDDYYMRYDAVMELYRSNHRAVKTPKGYRIARKMTQWQRRVR